MIAETKRGGGRPARRPSTTTRREVRSQAVLQRETWNPNTREVMTPEVRVPLGQRVVPVEARAMMIAVFHAVGTEIAAFSADHVRTQTS